VPAAQCRQMVKTRSAPAQTLAPSGVERMAHQF
jgi:hypothetical protein